MAPLTDPTRLAAYRDALSNWNYNLYIQFDLTEAAYQWIKQEIEGTPLKEIGRLMHEFVLAGGEIDEVKETVPNGLSTSFTMISGSPFTNDQFTSSPVSISGSLLFPMSLGLKW